MSPLTKVFVVLLVVASLLQTAGTVVFINKIGPLQKNLDIALSLKTVAENQRDAATNNANIAHAQNNAIVTQDEEARKGMAAVIGTMQQQISNQTTQIATLTNEKASLLASKERSEQQLTLALATNGQQTHDIATLRTNNDGLIKRQEADSHKISDLTNENETKTAEFNNTRENLVAAQSDIVKYQQFIQGLGRDWKEAVRQGFVPTGSATPPITGLVREKKMIEGVPYVTISVGSADGVLKGMKFSVLDTQGNFLCFVTVDTVDNNDAIGKLDGDTDKVNQVQVSDSVKTQIRGS